MENWIPAIISNFILIVLAFLSKNVIIERLKNAVKHEYDSKLASINAELASRQKELDAIRGGALSNLSERQNVLYSRQLKAVEELWEQVLKLSAAKQISATMVAIKFENALEMAEKDKKVREFFELINPVNLGDLPKSNASRVRPFVSSLAWAYYAAYEAIVMHAAIRMHMLKKGINLHSVIDNDRVVKLVKVALPDQTEYIEKYGAAGFHHMLEILEKNLLYSFQLMLDGQELDKASIRKAAEITKQAEELSRASTDEKA